MEFLAQQSGERLDKFLASRLPRLSRTKIQQLIKSGVVMINMKTVSKAGLKLKQNDRITLPDKKLIAIQPDLQLKPDPTIPLNIIYENDDMVIINKPAGLLTHPTANQRQHTLVNALLAKYPEIKNVGENPLRPGIVHRLDKDTSGLIIVAKNQQTFLYLKNQFGKRAITKKYLALVEGVPKQKVGMIEYAIRPSKYNRLKKVAVKFPDQILVRNSMEQLQAKKSYRAAQTKYKVKEIIKNKFALLEVEPLTGRTHQIRVHLAAIGHPIVGDKLYGSRDQKIKIARQFLHAYYLKLTLPNGTLLEVEIELPEELKQIVKT